MRLVAALGIIAVFISVLPTDEARACGGFMATQGELIVRSVHHGEAHRALERHAYDDALFNIRRGGHQARLFAKLTVRSDGAFDRHGSKAGTRRDNLEWAAKVLDFTSAYPAELTDSAEAMSKVPALFARASRILEDLATRDLITSAEGWAALARLRGPDDAAEAHRRCLLMAIDKEKSCGAAPNGII